MFKEKIIKIGEEMTKLWHPLLKLNFWFSGRVMWPRVEHCRFERFRVERPAFSGRNNGTAFQLRLVHSRNCFIKLCTIYGISVLSKLIMEWFFIKLLIKWTYLHACTCCDSEEINESSFESMRATSGRSATRSVRPEGVQGVQLSNELSFGYMCPFTTNVNNLSFYFNRLLPVI